jgi:hypothetical protein
MPIAKTWGQAQIPSRPGPADSVAQEAKSGLAEREHVGLCAGLEERDLQRPLADRVVLAHELVSGTRRSRPLSRTRVYRDNVAGPDLPEPRCPAG